MKAAHIRRDADAHSCAIRALHLVDNSMGRTVTEPTPDFEATGAAMAQRREDALQAERFARAIAPTLWPAAEALAWIMERDESAVREIALRNAPFSNDGTLAAEVLDEIALRGCLVDASTGQAWELRQERLCCARDQLASALQAGKLIAWAWTGGMDHPTELAASDFLQAGGAVTSPSCGLLAWRRVEFVLVRPGAARDLWPAPMPSTITRAPAYKVGVAPNDDAVLAKADEMRSRGMTGQALASQMRLEPGFENVATTQVRDLIKGRYKGGRRSGTNSP